MRTESIGATLAIVGGVMSADSYQRGEKTGAGRITNFS